MKVRPLDSDDDLLVGGSLLIGHTIPEMEILEGKLGFNDPSGLNSGAENILLCGNISRSYQPCQGIQVTANIEI